MEANNVIISSLERETIPRIPRRKKILPCDVNPEFKKWIQEKNKQTVGVETWEGKH